jgi:hypothetical protein
MNESHVDSVMLLAVPFHQDADFDFGKQTITQDIQVFLSAGGGAVCKGATPSVEQPGGRGFKPRLRTLLD